MSMLLERNEFIPAFTDTRYCSEHLLNVLSWKLNCFHKLCVFRKRSQTMLQVFIMHVAMLYLF